MEAVGLASAILTFVDFSSKIIAGSYDIYTSASGSSDENVDLRRVTEDLQLLTQRLNPTRATIIPAVQTNDDVVLAELARNCQQVAAELLAMLKTLQTQTPNSKRDSLRVALRSLRKKREVESLEKRLERYRRQIFDRTLLMMR